MSDRVDLDGPKPIYRLPPPEADRPDRSLLAVIVLAMLALAGVIALLPGTEEKAEGLLADGRYDDAIEILAATGAERPLDPYEDYLLFKLYILTKQPDSAAMLLEQAPALKSENAWARRQLSDLYRETRNFAGEATALRQLYDLDPTDTDFARLRMLYRLTGDAGNEASLLAQAIAAGRSERTFFERLDYLQNRAFDGSQAAIWVAPSGSFSNLAKAPPVQVMASSAAPAPSLE